MQRSTDRILTTHAGSLPRPADLLPMVFAQESGESVDPEEFEAGVRSAVKETVRKQMVAGVDVVNDGEVSKPSYATYVKDRLTGFGGEGSIETVAASVMDLEEFPDFADHLAATMESVSEIRFTTCDGPVAYVGQDAVRNDIENLKAALDGEAPAGTFMSAASPGVVAVFSPNQATIVLRYAFVVLALSVALTLAGLTAVRCGTSRGGLGSSSSRCRPSAWVSSSSRLPP